MIEFFVFNCFSMITPRHYLILFLRYSENVQWNSVVIRQKSESQNGCFKKIKHAKFSAKTNIFYPLIRTRTCAYRGIKNVRFCGKFGVLCFLEAPVLRFNLLPHYRRIKVLATLWNNFETVLSVRKLFELIYGKSLITNTLRVWQPLLLRMI